MPPTLLLLCLMIWSADALVSCKDNSNNPVDWFIIYKRTRVAPFTGKEYVYMDRNGVQMMKPGVPGYKPIDSPIGALAYTLTPLFVSRRMMAPTFGYISYSDQPPGANAHDTFGHSKGVVLVDLNGVGVWLTHSTPQFPYRRTAEKFYPSNGFINAQTFACVTFNYDQFRLIGKHLQYIGAYTFDYDLTPLHHLELHDAVNWKKDTPPNSFTPLRSISQYVYSIAKESKPIPEDLYVKIAKLVNSDVMAQTWGCQKPDPSHCPTNDYKVFNIRSVNTSVGIWGRTSDHSKWCVTTNTSSPWTCIADMNRAEKQYKRRGGALCFFDSYLQGVFNGFIDTDEPCTGPTPTPSSDNSCDVD